MKFKELYKNLSEGSKGLDKSKAFKKMADTQRYGDPEEFGEKNYLYTNYAGGTYSYALEHIGDLTHRFGTLNIDSTAFDNIKVKVKSHIHWLNRKEIERQIISNGNSKGVSAEEALEDVKSHGKNYANAHKEIPVYNEIQYHAREAAVSLGEWRFEDSVEHLKWIKSAIDDGTFMDKANEFTGEEYEV